MHILFSLEGQGNFRLECNFDGFPVPSQKNPPRVKGSVSNSCFSMLSQRAATNLENVNKID